MSEQAKWRQLCDEFRDHSAGDVITCQRLIT